MQGIRKTVAGARNVVPPILTLFLAATAIFLIGVADDRGGGVRWRWKLLFQVGTAVAIVTAGYRISAFSAVPGMNEVLSVLWIVGLTNAFNFIDGMDGLCAGVAAIACGVLAYFMSAYNHPLMLLFLMAMTGALLGFLRFNFKPARIFLGDAGSTFIGFMLAGITLQASYTTIETRTILPVLMPILVLAVPLYDTSSVVLVRLWRRRSPFQPDTNHLHHRLKRIGFSDRQTVLFIWTMVFITGIGATLLTQVDALGGTVVLVQALAIMGLFVILERVVQKEARAAKAANGCTDRLLSVPARFMTVSTNGRPKKISDVARRPAVAREFTSDRCVLVPEEPLHGPEIEDLLERRLAFKLELSLPMVNGNGGGAAGGAQEARAVCRLLAVETGREAEQALRLEMEKISGKNRRRLERFVAEAK